MADIASLEKTLKKIERFITALQEKETELPVTEEQAAKHMGINTTSFRNLYHSGKIPIDAVKIGPNHKRYYLLSKLFKLPTEIRNVS